MGFALRFCLSNNPVLQICSLYFTDCVEDTKTLERLVQYRERSDRMANSTSRP